MDTTGPAMQEFIIQPIGYITNQFENVTFESKANEDPKQRKVRLKAHQERLWENISIIEVLPEYESLLDGIDAFSHIIVVFWPHMLPENKRNIKKTHPRGWNDLPLQGVFATRSPARPNPVLFSTVALVKQEGRHLHVKGLDTMDKTPLIDIKPVVKPSDIKGPFRVPDWVEQIHDISAMGAD
ncbi:MAG: tRNA (N6-threonylcarbamoyladenosine(37)-N6)-methyltransferase TrmO [Desulfobacteraceae bacterium]|nr:tRNA (N6-threonylcarbamoyladenosine(37)-N6)-methyltransferase TrmO [Desulfobacteraceae bacterium]